MSAKATPPANPGPPLVVVALADHFKRDSRYREQRARGTDDWLLIYTTAGGGRMLGGGVFHEVRPGDLFIYRPGDPHDYGTSPETRTWSLTWAHFVPRAHWLPWLGWVEPAAHRLHLPAGPEREAIARALARMARCAALPFASGPDLAANALEEALIRADGLARHHEWRMDARVRRAIEILAADFRAEFRLRELARSCGASVSRLSALFKRDAGVSPQQFHEGLRLRHAGELLRRTDLRITEIAALVGYADPFYFSTRFRRFTGSSPSAFRAAAK